MPSLGADMEFGTLLEWLVKPGDGVKRGDIVAVVDTSKAEIEVEIFEDGVIDELLVAEHTRVPVGTVLATLHAPGAEAAPTKEPAAVAAEPAAAATPAAEAPTAAEPPTAETAAVSATSPAPVGVRPPLPPPRGILIVPASRRSPGAPPSSSASTSRPSSGRAPTGRSRERTSRPRRPRRSGRAGSGTRAAAGRPPGGRTPRGDARGDRCADGTLEARDPPLLPPDRNRHEPRDGVAARENPERAVDERLLPSVLLLSGGSAGRRIETPELNGFWVDGPSAGRRRPPRGRDLAARRGLIAPALHDADRQDPRRADGRAARPGRSVRGREAARLGDVRPDDHGHEPRRPGRRPRARRHLSAPGRARRLRRGRGAALRRRRDARRAPDRDRHARRGPSRQRRAHGRPLPNSIDRLLQDPEEL